jgi:hypothetical protein
MEGELATDNAGATGAGVGEAGKSVGVGGKAVGETATGMEGSVATGRVGAGLMDRSGPHAVTANKSTRPAEGILRSMKRIKGSIRETRRYG